MHNVWLLARREYLETVRKRSFIIMTILLPAMMFGFTVLPSMLMTRKSSEVQQIVIATPDAQFAADIRDRITGKSGDHNIRSFSVDVDTRVSAAEEAALSQRVSAKEVDGYLWAPADALAARKLTYRARSSSDFVVQGTLDDAVRYAFLRKGLRSEGVSDKAADELMKPVRLEALKIQNGKIAEGGGVGVFFTALLLMVLLYTTLIMYGMSVMRSVLEEKNSRIFEVLLSAATPKQLMAGKILGAGAVGLTQIGIWTTTAAVLGTASMISIGGERFHLNVSVFNMVFFGIFFVLGFLLYSSLSAALGASVNSEQEAQQLQMLVLMPLILCMVFMAQIIQQPHSTLSVVLSLIPFCTPLLMYVRIVVETPPMWQIGLSVVLLVGTIYAMLSLCSRIYRVGILMYGKRPTLPEILKWVKYA